MGLLFPKKKMYCSSFTPRKASKNPKFIIQKAVRCFLLVSVFFLF